MPIKIIAVDYIDFMDLVFLGNCEIIKFGLSSLSLFDIFIIIIINSEQTQTREFSIIDYDFDFNENSIINIIFS